jgi:hypothetical protein
MLEDARPAAGQDDGQLFDLSEVRAQARNMNRSIVWSFSLLGALTAPMGAYLVYHGLTGLASKGGWTSAIGIDLLIATVFLWLNSIWCFLFASKKLPGADHLRISNVGVELSVGGSVANSWTWSSPRDRFVLEDDTQAPGTGAVDLPSYYLKKPGFWSRSTALSREAFDAILAAASRNGATVSQRPGSPWIGSYPVTLYEVTGASSR